ncbi:hypothetical protein HAX54_033896 [Datura stramonium]|uniref:Uncharacterized protein n=1 Tax=Datura stramonium TaxID=4076 RepID=A0ABS8VGM5_DATST|nr:hypothetical protein [Datura stramonium]
MPGIILSSWAAFGAIREFRLLLNGSMKSDNNELAFSSLEFFLKWVIGGESVRPPVLLTIDELLVAALRTAGITYNTELLNDAWEVLKRSLW